MRPSINTPFAVRILLLTFILISATSLSIQAQEKAKTEDKKLIIIEVRDMITGDPVKDSITVELLRPDSALLMSHRLEIRKDRIGRIESSEAWFNAPGKNFLVRLSHPDYETALRPLNLKRARQVLTIRKLTKSEKARMLGEVTVTASKLEFVHKGDTIQFNADAFELAEGSMLSALIRRLPGAELKDNGQIFVNGRFVDKLLLDGKDFFKNDKLVLLQNLPAYTVKNIKVYEENLPEQLARKGSQDPDYVMDVKLKKEFNAGWLANAEAGGGTHSRYRLRGFGLLYNQKSRFGAYALMNNLNEAGSPDMSGDWQNATKTTGQVISKGGGLDYDIQPKTGLEFSGSATAQYQNVFNNLLTNRQNYIPEGDNYTRRWYDSSLGNLQIDTQHHAKFDVRQGSHETDATFSYGDDNSKSETTEGTFGSIPGDYPEMRDELQAGMPESRDILNRYLSATSHNSKRAEGGLKYRWYKYFTDSNIVSMSASAKGNLTHRWQKGSDRYLLQYAGVPAQDSRRENPQSSHGYSYGASYGLTLGKLDKGILMLNYEVENSYTRSNTMLYDILDSENPDSENPLQQWLRVEQLRRELDARNSYLYGLHSLEQNFSATYQFDRRERDERGRDLSRVRLSIGPNVSYLHRSMNFNGYDSQLLKRDSWLPGAWLNFYIIKKNLPYFAFSYDMSSAAPQMMDLLNISFDADPMNPSVGNPDLKQSLTHNFNFDFNSYKYYWSKLYVTFSAKFQTIHNLITYATSYDMATGIRTLSPANINGNRNGRLSLTLRLIPDSRRRFMITNTFAFRPSRFANFISTTDMQGMKKSISNRNAFDEIFSAEYKSKIFTITAQLAYTNMRAMSLTQDFRDYTTQYLSYGLRGLLRLPSNFELSSNISMVKNYGYTDSQFNKGQLIWNARISKSILRGKLLFTFDGYDMLNQVKKVDFNITSAYRLEERYNSVPSYFMFTIKYFFSKKPRE